MDVHARAAKIVCIEIALAHALISRQRCSQASAGQARKKTQVQVGEPRSKCAVATGDGEAAPDAAASPASAEGSLAAEVATGTSRADNAENKQAGQQNKRRRRA
jgi:hypothetical protein